MLPTIETGAVSRKDEDSYERGVKLATSWIAGGGSLTADGPDTKGEAFYNGFIDTLADARRARAKKGS